MLLDRDPKAAEAARGTRSSNPRMLRIQLRTVGNTARKGMSGELKTRPVATYVCGGGEKMRAGRDGTMCNWKGGDGENNVR